MSLNDVVVTFRLPAPVTVTRAGPGSFVAGRFVPDPSPTVIVLNTSTDDAVSSVPGSGQVVKPAADGQLAENTRIVYSKTELRARTPAGPGDILALPDGDYEVVSAKDWAGSIGDGTQDCWECVVALQETP